MLTHHCERKRTRTHARKGKKSTYELACEYFVVQTSSAQRGEEGREGREGRREGRETQRRPPPPSFPGPNAFDANSHVVGVIRSLDAVISLTPFRPMYQRRSAVLCHALLTTPVSSYQINSKRQNWGANGASGAEKGKGLTRDLKRTTSMRLPPCSGCNPCSTATSSVGV